MDPSRAAKGCNPADMHGNGAPDHLGVPRLGSGCYPADMYAARLGSPLRTPPGGAPPSPSHLPPPSASFTKGCNPADMSLTFTKTLPPSAYRAAVAGVIQRTPPSPHRRHPCTSAAIRAAAVDLRHGGRPHEATQEATQEATPWGVPGGQLGGVPGGTRAGSPPRAAQSPPRAARSPQLTAREAAGREAAGRDASADGFLQESFLQEAMLEWERMQAAH